jgi:hypothetical protein
MMLTNWDLSAPDFRPWSSYNWASLVVGVAELHPIECDARKLASRGTFLAPKPYLEARQGSGRILILEDGITWKGGWMIGL